MKRLKKAISVILCVLIVMSMAVSASAIKAVAVTGIRLSQTNVTISLGTTLDLNVTFIPANATQKLLKFSTSNVNVAAIDAKGKITAKAAGTAVITVTSTANAKATAKCTVKVVDETVDIEVWDTNTGFKPIEKGSPAYEFYKKYFGVGIIMPYVEWNGGTTYLQQLNLRIAAGEMPDVFVPFNGIESALAKNGAVLDLTDLLPKKAPDLWNLVPKNVWDIIKTYDPNGQGRIYSAANSCDYEMYGGLIRKDWLDKLGLSIPKNQDEFVKVLQAFRTKDPNRNGIVDEIPTGGRQNGAWMDHLFAMYGIAMKEGQPQWDIYNGQLTYSAVTKNMKDCLMWLRTLYDQFLLDRETFLNDKAKWDGKVNANRVGVFYRILQEMYMYPEAIYQNTGVKAEFEVLPPISAPGYSGYYTKLTQKSVGYLVKNQKDEKKVDACFKFLNALANKSNWYDLYLGVEGQHHVVQNGKKIKLPDDKTTQQNLIAPYNGYLSIDFYNILLKRTMEDAPDRKWAVNQAYQTLNDVQKYGKVIAGDGIPALIYDGYPDIQNRTLYNEYVAKIVTGEYPISKFDEFVDKWNKSGGEAVTKAAREWYAKKK
jgi:putative aldouronate transport system substrate-binding protein